MSAFTELYNTVWGGGGQAWDLLGQITKTSDTESF
jgi:hypothetical protein